MELKGFIELTSLKGNTRLIRVDEIVMVNKIVSFTQREYEELPELKELESCTSLYLSDKCLTYWIKEPYEDVVAKMEKAMQCQSSRE